MGVATSNVCRAWHISPNSDKPYSLDLVNELTDSAGVVDTVVAIDWRVENNDGTFVLHSPSVIGTVITIWARTAKAGTTYRVTPLVTTGSGVKLEVPILLCAIEKDGDSTSLVTWP